MNGKFTVTAENSTVVSEAKAGEIMSPVLLAGRM